MRREEFRRISRQRWTTLACIALMLPSIPLRGQEPGAAYVTYGDSKQPHDIKSMEILLQPIPPKETAPVVTALSASPGGKLLAAAGDDHHIRIIDVESGETVRSLNQHTDWIKALVFTSDGQQLYSAGNDGKVLRWSVHFEQQPQLLLKLPFAVKCLSIATERQLLALGGFSNEIIVWNLAERQILYRLLCDCSDQHCVRFSPNGNHVLCGGRDGSLHVWQMSDGREIASFREHRGSVQTAAFAADGTLVTSVGTDRQLIQYDLNSRRVRLVRELAHSKLMSMCMINNDLVAVAGADNSVHLYDVLEDTVVAHLKGHVGTVAVMELCGSYLASGSFDTSIRIWDLGTIDAGKIEYGKPVHAPMDIDDRLRIR